MEQEELYNAIFKRKSVRKFETEPLDAAMLAKISAFLDTVKPMVPGIRTELKILASADVKSGIGRAKVQHFVAIFTQRNRLDLANAGFMLEQVDLFLSASGIGSLWQGNPRPAREMSNLEFVIMLAIGRSKEPVHRESVAEFKRVPLGKVNMAIGVEELLEPARLAPSATNGQPWLFMGDDKAIHFYQAISPYFERWNGIGVGAAICHAWLAALHFGKGVEFVQDQAGEQETPRKYHYVTTMRLLPKQVTEVVAEPKPQVTYSFEVSIDPTQAR